MAVLSFKDVGEKTADITQRRATATADTLPPPLGVVTPVRSGGDGDGFFKMHRSLPDQLKDNLRNLLQTNYGDRVMLYDFGANLQPLVFEVTSRDDFETEAMLRIKRAVDRHMPFIELREFEKSLVLTNAGSSTGHVDIRLTYSIPQAGVANDMLVVRFDVGG